jgi:UDP-N-acetyl-2-amino-2-deoxyglucuronate dehydrogenase
MILDKIQEYENAIIKAGITEQCLSGRSNCDVIGTMSFIMGELNMIRIGISGIGAIAQNYIELFCTGKINGARITALSSRNKENMEKVKRENSLHEVTLYTDYEELLKSGEIDAVMICTPHAQHAEMAVKAMEYGRHVLIEKPIGSNINDVGGLDAMVKLHPELTAGVLYCRRMSKAYTKMKEMVMNGAVGSLKRANWLITNLYRTDAYHKSSPWRGTYRGEGGGVMLTQASHQLDLFLWMTGMPTRIQGFCYEGMERNIEVENDVMLQMEFENGATGQFMASSREYPGTNRFELSGDAGQLIIEDDRRLIYRRLSRNESDYNKHTNQFFGPIVYETEEYEFDDFNNQVQQAEIINNFIEAIKTKKKTICSVEEAIGSLRVINGAYLSSWEKKKIEMPFVPEEYQKRLNEYLDTI